MIKRVMMCVISLLVLSACDTGGNNASSSTTNSITGESYTPINLETATAGTTGMIISGAIDHNTGDVDAFWIRLGNRLESYRNIEVETRNGYLLRLTHLASSSDGTYPINTSLDIVPDDDNFAGGLLYLWSPDEAEQFIYNPQGSITVTFQNNIIAGSFTMTAENLAGESVSIEGIFSTQESGSAVSTN